MQNKVSILLGAYSLMIALEVIVHITTSEPHADECVGPLKPTIRICIIPLSLSLCNLSFVRVSIPYMKHRSGASTAGTGIAGSGNAGTGDPAGGQYLSERAHWGCIAV